MSVCVGAEVLASAGTAERITRRRRLAPGLVGPSPELPRCSGKTGVRFADDADLITTAGVLSEWTVPCASSSGWSGRMRPDEPHGRPLARLRTGPGRGDRKVATGACRCGSRAQRRLPLGPPDHRGAAHRRCRRDGAGLGIPAVHDAVLPRPAGPDHRRRAADHLSARPDLRSPRRRPVRRLRPGPAPGPRCRRSRRRRNRPRHSLRPVYLHDQPGFAFDGALPTSPGPRTRRPRGG